MNFYGHIIFTVFNLLLPRLLLELRNCFSAPVGIWLLPLLHTGSYGVNQFTLVNRFLNGLITKVYTRRKKRITWKLEFMEAEWRSINFLEEKL